MYNSIIYHQYIALCVHHPKSSLLLPFIPTLPSSTCPHTSSPLVLTMLLSSTAFNLPIYEQSFFLIAFSRDFQSLVKLNSRYLKLLQKVSLFSFHFLMCYQVINKFIFNNPIFSGILNVIRLVIHLQLQLFGVHNLQESQF